MVQQNRQEKIVELVHKYGYVSIDELATAFNVTPQTIRRDINQLAEDNRLRRYHGGAAATGVSSTVNMAYNERKILQLAEKERIAQTVAERIPDGASLFINIGTTNEAIARALLPRKDLKVITNNLHVASILTANNDFQITICGGVVRNRDGGITGEATIDFVNQFRVDFGIIGISGIDETGALLDFDYQEVRVAQAIIKNSSQVILAADHTKFGRKAVNYLGDVALIDTLITDEQPRPAYLEPIQKSGLEMVIAP